MYVQCLMLVDLWLRRVVKANLSHSSGSLNLIDVVPQHSSDLLQWATALKVIHFGQGCKHVRLLHSGVACQNSTFKV